MGTLARPRRGLPYFKCERVAVQDKKLGSVRFAPDRETVTENYSTTTKKVCDSREYERIFKSGWTVKRRILDSLLA